MNDGPDIGAWIRWDGSRGGINISVQIPVDRRATSSSRGTNEGLRDTWWATVGNGARVEV
jgi:hypothetical protein